MSSEKIIPLFSKSDVEVATGDAPADIIELLKTTIEEAERGEIDGIGIAISRPNDTIGTRWIFGSANFRLIAAVSILHANLMQSGIEKQVDV